VGTLRACAPQFNRYTYQKMNIPITDELKKICDDIVKADWTESQWAGHEADDWFHTDNFEGGFDADENAFCFSYSAPNRDEILFQISLSDVKRILNGQKSTILGRIAE